MRLAPPTLVILVILGGATLLLVGGSSKPALPGNAAVAQGASFSGESLSPPEPAPAIDTLRNYDGTSFNLAAQRGQLQARATDPRRYATARPVDGTPESTPAPCPSSGPPTLMR